MEIYVDYSLLTCMECNNKVFGDMVEDREFSIGHRIWSLQVYSNKVIGIPIIFIFVRFACSTMELKTFLAFPFLF